MTLLIRRLEALEVSAPPAEPLVILRHIVDPGPRTEVMTAEFNGRCIEREPTETEADFIARASAAALEGLSSRQVGRVVLTPGPQSLREALADLGPPQ